MMNKKRLIQIGVFILIVITATNMYFASADVAPLKRRGENLIRFHVLANSNSPEDQKLKLKVRDEVIGAMSGRLENSKNIEETREVLEESMKYIEDVARGKIISSGENYDVKTTIGEYDFPTKRYGNVVFEAGKYEALRIIIGEGKGDNWWCVMFPPLCFIDIKHGLTDEKTKSELKAALSEEEYNLVYSEINKDELPLQLKSKIFELFKASRDQIYRLTSIF